MGDCKEDEEFVLIPKTLSQDDVKSILFGGEDGRRSLITWHHYLIKHFKQKKETKTGK